VAAALGCAGCVTVLEDGGFEWGWDESEEAAGGDVWERLRVQLARHDPNAAKEFWARSLSALHGDDIERLAQMGETARWVSSRAAWLPGVREYASWLESRQEYFEAARQASEAARQAREAAERAARDAATRVALPGEGTRARPPIVGLPTAPVLNLPKLPPATTAFSKAPPPKASSRGASRGKRGESVETGRAYWRQRVAKRDAPAAAADVLPAIKAAFAAEGLPVELVWVAEVESSMNPSARSPVGAVGLFQLMPKTAVSLGLSLRPEDERLDPRANARAAAKYLRSLHGRFDSWPLALAAYNAGQGRVSSLCRKHGRSFDAIVEHLPLETRLYVPRVLETVRARTGADPETLPGPA
jgi:membrane-bound lytic murein transglycosylase D